MAAIAVVHPNLGTRGGAEDVCMHVLESLQSDHHLVLFTLTRPDFPALNRYFETDVKPLEVRLAGHVALELNRRAGNRLLRLQAALMGRYVRQHEAEFDLVFSTKNEFAFDSPSIQYVHSPQFTAADPGIDRADSKQRAYDRLCSRLAGVSAGRLRSSVLLTNSDWTADVVSSAYGIDAETVYPPVDSDRFPERSWERRESGFLTIGRIGPSKNVLQNIDVVRRLRERGHDVHLHVVGPTTDDEYSERVERVAAATEFVSIEGAVDYDRLLELIAGHRYGLHGRPYEHFGIAVAELVAGGTIPFAPNSGGQREILSENPQLLYEGPDDAVEKIDRVLSSPRLQRSLSDELQRSNPAPSPAQFEATVRSIVEETLPR